MLNYSLVQTQSPLVLRFCFLLCKFIESFLGAQGTTAETESSDNGVLSLPIMADPTGFQFSSCRAGSPTVNWSASQLQNAAVVNVSVIISETNGALLLSGPTNGLSGWWVRDLHSSNTSPTDKQWTFTITSSYHNNYSLLSQNDVFHRSQIDMAVAVYQNLRRIVAVWLCWGRHCGLG